MSARPKADRRAGAEFNDLRPLLFSIAYRMVSSVADADDIVQDAFLRYQRALEQDVVIASPKAYLSAITTRLAIDRLRSAQERRETYVGQWLPEPLLTEKDDPARATEDEESVSMAFLLALERLNPVERAVFLLHDVFDYEYGEVAEIVGKTETNCRQLASRARGHVRAERPRFDVSRQRREELASRFFAALRTGDVDGLATTLAADVVVYGDGGGKAPQVARPVVGREPVGKFIANLGRQMATLDVTLDERQINGQPGAIFRDREGSIISVFALDIVEGSIQAIRSVINPDKLHHIGPVADAWALAREARAKRRGALHSVSPS
jgi:RNA polymerase sigma-70 factor, ECF subfamily